jgi:hypothetical protein
MRAVAETLLPTLSYSSHQIRRDKVAGDFAIGAGVWHVAWAACPGVAVDENAARCSGQGGKGRAIFEFTSPKRTPRHQDAKQGENPTKILVFFLGVLVSWRSFWMRTLRSRLPRTWAGRPRYRGVGCVVAFAYLPIKLSSSSRWGCSGSRSRTIFHWVTALAYCCDSW